jgi:hypothetical protein
MPGKRNSAAAALCAFGFAASVVTAPAHAEPPGCPTATVVDGDACSATLTAVTANGFDLTGTPVGGQTPITVSGASEAYLLSTGFASPPASVHEWDATIDRVNALPPPGSPPDPGWYGDGKSRAFLPVQLNQLATQFPPGTVMVRFVPDESNPGLFRLLSVQPVG